MSALLKWLSEFQPTPSARRVTIRSDLWEEAQNISTHTLRKEGDYDTIDKIVYVVNFNPHPPQGG